MTFSRKTGSGKFFGEEMKAESFFGIKEVGGREFFGPWNPQSLAKVTPKFCSFANFDSYF